MSGKTYQVKDVARLAKVTVRTLHHYDSIGLLVPSDRTFAGYRVYNDDDLIRLQQILICRELGLPLKKIQRLLNVPDFDRRQTLSEHRRLLERRVETTEAMIRSVDRALRTLRGDTKMTAEGLFEGFDPSEHEAEAEERWGGTDMYREAARRTKRYSKEDWALIQGENQELIEAMAERFTKGAEPDAEDVLDLAEQMRMHIDRWYYPCSRGMHAALAEMYTGDPRFAANYDRYKEGLAEFISEAIRANNREN